MKIPRISGIVCERVAEILYKGQPIGTISEGTNFGYQTDWVIELDWEAWERAGKPFFYGVNTDLRRKMYVRRELPEFIDVRTPPDDRTDIDVLLKQYGMTEPDRFEFMCRHGGEHGDNYTVRYLGYRQWDWVNGIRGELVRCSIDD